MSEFKQWHSIRDGHDDDDPDDTWAKEINSDKYGKYAWITDNGDGFEITSSVQMDHPIMTCKSLMSAKRWVMVNMAQI